ncbi:MAG TPA: hypothetical protein VM012_04500 [Flavitalea sp.]|nr:hypothetical protein [Flavitalea sp.]
MLEEGLRRVQDKLQQLLKQHSKLQQENEKLLHLLQDAERKESSTNEKIEQLEQEVIILKSATSQLNESDKKELEKKLNYYLKEIDRCINVLGE